MLFAHMMDKKYGGVEAALQFSQEAEQCGDVGAGVFVGAMEADEGIEEEELRANVFDSGGESGSVGIEIEPEGGGIDEVQVEVADVEAAVVADAEDAFADHGCCVFGEVDESGSGACDGEASETGRSRSDAECNVETEPGLAAFWCAADNAYGPSTPEVFDEPTVSRKARGDLRDPFYGERLCGQISSFLAATTWAEETTESSDAAAFQRALRARASTARRFPLESSKMDSAAPLSKGKSAAPATAVRC